MPEHTKIFHKAMIVLIGLQIYAKNFVGFLYEMDTISITITHFAKFLLHNAFWPSDRRVKNIESTRQTPCIKSKPKRSTLKEERGGKPACGGWRAGC